MIREVDLVSYLPPFLADYKETNATLTAENPEFVLVWNAADRVLRNEFITTADEYGISRFEKILKILPSGNDTLESRRVRVQSRWFTMLPYTWRMLIRKLTVLCGENNFTVTKQSDFYRIDLDVQCELFGQVDELERMLDAVLPCNIVTGTWNREKCSADGKFSAYGGVAYAEEISITSETMNYIKGKQCVYGGIAHAQDIHITVGEEQNG